MKRREVIMFLGGAAAALPSFVALAQVPTKRAVIGLLLAGSKTATQQRRSGFPVGMREFGYAQGQDYVIEDRHAGEYQQSIECSSSSKCRGRHRCARAQACDRRGPRAR